MLITSKEILSGDRIRNVAGNRIAIAFYRRFATSGILLPQM